MGKEIHWSFPTQECDLEPGEVHVWAADLDVPSKDFEQFAESLSTREIERAARFHFERDRKRFVAGRGLMRTLLSRYLQIEPSGIEFRYNAQGKPSVVTAGAGDSLQFNLTHCEDLALLAVTRLAEVGVDIERVRALEDFDDLVRKFFSSRESAAFANLGVEEKPAAFFNLWTRKEAWLKATGEGIAHSLHLVEVAFLPGESARLVNLPRQLAGGTRWTLHELDPAENFTAALAINGAPESLKCWRCPRENMVSL